MGLFQFMKDMGEKIAGGKLDGPAIEEKIKKDLGSQIIEIKAQFEGEVVTLSGICDSQAAREKAVLIAGNLKGVSSISYFALKVKETIVQPATTPEEVKAEQEPATDEATAAETEFYTIVSGDTLSKIAKKYYGNANKYPMIFEANKEVIKDADKIYVGQTIRIPKIDT